MDWTNTVACMCVSLAFAVVVLYTLLYCYRRTARVVQATPEPIEERLVPNVGYKN